MTTNAKWTEDRTAQLTNIVGAPGASISKETVESAATALETTVRSIAAKLRKLGYTVASLAKDNVPTFTEDEAARLKGFVEGNSGALTYAQVAEGFDNGKFSAKQVQGKILSMELTSHIKPAEKLEVARTYTPSEEATFVSLAKQGKFLEDIAEALNKSLSSVRGKALSMLRSGELEKIPAQKESHADPAKGKDVFEGVDVAGMTVAEIVAATSKTERGVRTMLTKRGLSAKDYDGASKKAKAVEKRAA